MRRITRTLINGVLIFSLAAVPAAAAVKAVAADGEATVYVRADFTSQFDLAYRAELRAAPRNRSWSWLSILLIGSKIPGPGVSIGLANGPNGAALSAFTYAVYGPSKDAYRSRPVKCPRGCIIELRANGTSIEARLNGVTMAMWPRSAFGLAAPSVQLNAEVHGAGDRLRATLLPVRTTAAGRPIPVPSCAFTTRGIEPSGRAALAFTGVNRNAPGQFIDLRSGHRGDTCSKTSKR